MSPFYRPPSPALARPGFRGAATAPPIARPARPAAAPELPRKSSLRAGIYSLVTAPKYTLLYTAFLMYLVGSVTSRFPLAQPAIVLAMLGLLIQKEKFRFGSTSMWLVGFIVWSLFGFMQTKYGDAVLDREIDMIKLTIIFIVGLNALRTHAQIRMATAVILVSFLFYPARGAILNYVTGAYTVAGRAAWNNIYANPNDLGAITLLVLAAIMGASMREPKGLLLQLLRLAIAVLAVLIFLTQSRGVIIALSLFVITFLVSLRGRDRMRALAGMVVLGVAVVIFAPSSVWDRLSGLQHVTNTAHLEEVDPEGSAQGRFDIWKVGTRVTLEHPLFGVGLAAYPLAHWPTAKLMTTRLHRSVYGPRDAHSTYVTYAAETGIPGLVLFLTFIGSALRRVHRVRVAARIRAPMAARQLLCLELGVIGILISCIWNTFGHISFLYVYLLLLLATTAAWQRDLNIKV